MSERSVGRLVGFQDVFCFDWQLEEAAGLTSQAPGGPSGAARRSITRAGWSEPSRQRQEMSVPASSGSSTLSRGTGGRPAGAGGAELPAAAAAAFSLPLPPLPP